MRELKYLEAIREGLFEEMERDERVFLIGEDVERGWSFTVTKGLRERFGERVRNTPISENSFVGLAVGAALTGMRSIVEINYSDFLTLPMDQIVNLAAKYRYMTGGQARVPMVIRTPVGAPGGFAAQHSQSNYAWFAHVPGLKVALPATPYDAKGLLKTAVRDDNPVLIFEHKKLYNTKGQVPEGDYSVPFGQARIARAGTDVTIVAFAYMVQLALEAAETLAGEGISAEVIDPRTISPLDAEAICASVKKTAHLVVVDEAVGPAGMAAEVAALVAEHALEYLDAPVKRVNTEFVPLPFNVRQEQALLANSGRIAAAVKELL